VVRRTVLVTGGGSGIGLATAVAFAGQGHRIVVCGRDPARLAQALPLIGPDAVAISMDVADERSVHAGLERLADQGVALDVLVNAAGLIGHNATVDGAMTAALRANLAVNVTGPALVCERLVPAMAARGWGRVVNVASTAGLAAPPGQLPYAVSKAALIALTRSLAVDVAGRGVTVNAVAPGPVLTDDFRRRKGEAGIAARGRPIPSGRLTTPEEVAAAIVWLAAEEAAQITGQTLTIDGGEAAVGPYATLVAAARGA
jgi:NAD(P)-dependent dehydrogenase (short-subunit alcohol dehydrogenase family)